MSRFALAASLVAALALAACSAAPIEPSPTPAANPVTPSTPPTAPPPTAAPPTAAPPVATPRPSARPAPESPGSLADFTAEERYLFDGVLRGATECAPAGGSDELPRDAIAGIECYSDDPGVARIGFYLFENDADMVDAYVFRMKAEGVALDSGNCRDGEHEGAYTPGDGLLPSRNGCFINDEGYANYRATLPGFHVYIGILGAMDNMPYLEDFAWNGNTDMPGGPTLWGDPS
jgi:hypothetical protein